jgi:hypothetical protein
VITDTPTFQILKEAMKGMKPRRSNFVEIKLTKTFSALCIWKSNINEITGDHANENYEVNMWGKYCRIYPFKMTILGWQFNT